jgi:hypothetical protein
MVACFEGMGCFWCWHLQWRQWCSLMRMLHLPWFDSFNQESLADSFANFYIPKSVNNLLKAWLIILLALLISLAV